MPRRPSDFVDQPNDGDERRGGNTPPHRDTEPDGDARIAIDRRGVKGTGLDDLSGLRRADDPTRDWPTDLPRPVGEQPLDADDPTRDWPNDLPRPLGEQPLDGDNPTRDWPNDLPRPLGEEPLDGDNPTRDWPDDLPRPVGEQPLDGDNPTRDWPNDLPRPLGEQPLDGDNPTRDWPNDLPRPVGEQPLDGGYIGRTTRAELADGRTVVVKRCPYPAAQEADGLRALAEAGAPVPAVLGVGDRTLVLEWVEGEPDWPALGRAVARMHRRTGDRFGWPIENFHGRFPQDNAWSDSWPTFYVQRRVAPQLARAALPADLRARIEAACAGPLPALLRPDPPASLTHGDLWPGNMIDGRWLVDPAVSYADRELDLAYLSLSDDLPPEFMIAYRDEYPIEPDFEERRPALLLHKYLVNVRHFGDHTLPRLWTLLEHYGW